MKVFIIGNGFDLAHGLPTSYFDFICFGRCVIYDNFQCLCDSWKSNIQKTTENIKRITQAIKEEKDQNTQLFCAIRDALIENVWFHYFEKSLKTNKTGRWIDFEKEISLVIQSLEKEEIKWVENLSKFSDVKHKDLTCNKEIIVLLNKYIKNEDDYKTKLVSDLDDLTYALKLYLYYFVESKCIPQKLNEIQDMAPDYVLSFNYTHTYSTLYSKVAKVIYIHGETDSQLEKIGTNMVIGIDEYLDPDTRNTNVNFSIFKKFARRILFNTDTSYRDVRKEIMKRSSQLFEGNSNFAINQIKKDDLEIQGKSQLIQYYSDDEHTDKITNITVFGHSLDITDKEILRSFFYPFATKICVYAKDYPAKGNLIANLIRIIDEDRLIEKNELGLISFILPKNTIN